MKIQNIAIVGSLAMMLLATGCQTTKTSLEPQPIGGDTDAHGCLISAGQTYSTLKEECVQVFDVADIQLTDPNNHRLAVYVILSEDKSQAEVFWASEPQPILMDVFKGGYLSKDSKIRLVKIADGWRIRC